MQMDFHYYAAYCAAILAGWTHEESLAIACADQFVDCCSASFLKKVSGPLSATTTQMQGELVDQRTDIIGLQDITRIWASFHFLPYDLYARPKTRTRSYRSKFALICRPNGALVADTVKLAKGRGTEAAGVAMHVLCDTWAHTYFAGTPSLVINNTNYHFYEILPDGTRRVIGFQHNPAAADDPVSGRYTNSIYRTSEHSIMNLGHGRAGHLPDYSYARYAYLPAWGDYREIVKDNPSEYYHAFAQMVQALRYLHGAEADFAVEQYAWDVVAPYEAEIRAILEKRQLNAEADWKAFGEKLSGQEISVFSTAPYEQEYRAAGTDGNDSTCLGRFILAALAQKSMVTGKIFRSGNMLAGFAVDVSAKGFHGIRDFRMLVRQWKEVSSK